MNTDSQANLQLAKSHSLLMHVIQYDFVASANLQVVSEVNSDLSIHKLAECLGSFHAIALLKVCEQLLK